MMRSTSWWVCTALLMVLGRPVQAQPPNAEAQKSKAPKVKVLQSISGDQLEAILKDLGITYKKSFGFPLGSVDYSYMRHNFSIRIHNTNNADLWIDAYFAKIPAEDVNRWNRQARLSRAVLITTGPVVSVSVEAQLVCAGGVTEGMIKQFITNFDKEVLGFSAFLRTIVQEEEEIKSIAAPHLEKLMKDFNLQFKTSGGDGKDLRFEFTMNKHKMLLTCHEGSVLVLRSIYAQMPLDKINQYNINRRYVRAFIDTVDGREVTALESYLDCRGGVTESILRSFLARFSQELKEMDRFATF